MKNMEADETNKVSDQAGTGEKQDGWFTSFIVYMQQQSSSIALVFHTEIFL